MTRARSDGLAMTREEIALALERAPSGIALAPFARAVRALPVLRKCAHCTWCAPTVPNNGTFYCVEKGHRVDRDAAPPRWCQWRRKR